MGPTIPCQVAGNCDSFLSGCQIRNRNCFSNKSQPQCLCQILNGGSSQLGLNINQTQALQLPNACNVQTPPISQCKAAAPSADSPAGASDTPSPTTAGQGNGSNTVPTPDVDSSRGSSAALPSIILVFFLSLCRVLCQFLNHTLLVV